MKKMLTMTAAVCLLGSATVFATAADGEGQEHNTRILEDMAGEVVTIFKGNPSVVNHQTGEPADGSEIARKIRPGEIELFKGELVTVIQTDAAGDALPPDEPSRLVSHLETLTSDGALVLSGETVPTSIMLDRGMLKNPGPDDVHAIVLFDGRSRQVTIKPGDGVAANFQELPVADTPAVGSKAVCDCLCRGNGRKAITRIECGSAEQFQTIGGLIAACDCSGFSDFSCTIDIDGDGDNDIVDGDVSNCIGKIIND